MKGDDEITIKQVRQLLADFESEDGKYKTIELINFLNSFVFIKEKQDAFYQEQVYENMKKMFANTYDEHDVINFIQNSTYVPTSNEGNQQLNRNVLYQLFDSHLHKGSHVEIAEEDKQKQFNAFMEKFRNQLVQNLF